VTIVDERTMRAPVDACFRAASDVERWPDILPHYRLVRFHERSGDEGRVEMAAWRDFRVFRWPTWWLSAMRIDRDEPAVHYRHVQGITRGMVVKWSFVSRPGGATHVTVTHAWNGPPWPFIGGLAWRLVIAPLFVSAIARRTLEGVARAAEQNASLETARSSRTGAAPGGSRNATS
jgi:ribosome-associated toxin RatA of RatAB toxin-antitoxin module